MLGRKLSSCFQLPPYPSFRLPESTSIPLIAKVIRYALNIELILLIAKRTKFQNQEIKQDYDPFVAIAPI